MILGCIADDFTGASDIAGILAAEGMHTGLLTELSDIATSPSEAGVLALKSRSIPANDAVAMSLQALDRFRAAGCRQIFFKYCSTFDSSPDGNIGPVAEALANALGARNVVVCPAFPANGRTVYMGNLFVGDVALADSGMRGHPVTPMTDSDIRRWLKQQSRGPVSHIMHPVVRRGEDAIRAQLAEREGLVVVDAIDDDDLRAIAPALRDAPLITGGSALAMGLPDNYRKAGLIGQGAEARVGVAGPAIILAGSCSDATLRQVATYRTMHPSLGIDVARLIAGDPIRDECDAFLIEHAARAPLIFSSAPAEARKKDDGHDPRVVSRRIEDLLAELARRAATRGVKRFVVAGGETSGAVTAALRPGPLTVGQSICPGVPALGNGSLALALKSGNFGGDDFFEAALRALEPRQ